MALDDLTRYQHGALAATLFQSEEGQMYVGGALEQLASDMHIEEKAEGFIKGAMASKEGVQTAVGTYAEKYQKARESLSIKDLTNHYSPFIEDYLTPEESKKIYSELGKFSDENYGDINKSLKKAKYILGGKDIYDFPDEEKEWSQNTQEKYKNLMKILEILEIDKMERLRPNSVRRVHKELFKGLAKSLD